MDRMVEVTRYGGWGSKGAYRKMTALEMVNWMNRNGYKLRSSRDRKDGRRNLRFCKDGCQTEYNVVC